VDRRRFVQAGISTLFIPNAVMCGPGGAIGGSQPAAIPFFYDERFAHARHLAEDLSGIAEPIPVQSDVTPIWTTGLSRASVLAPMTLMGATTESFFFCLRILLVDQVKVDAQVRRFDRDLHLWTIRTGNHFKNGTVSWQNLSRPA